MDIQVALSEGRHPDFWGKNQLSLALRLLHFLMSQMEQVRFDGSIDMNGLVDALAMLRVRSAEFVAMWTYHEGNQWSSCFSVGVWATGCPNDLKLSCWNSPKRKPKGDA